MYPLLLKPPIKDYLWGGTKLKTDYNLETEKQIAAEGWMLSCHKDGNSLILNGEFKGKTLRGVLEIWEMIRWVKIHPNLSISRY